MRDLIIKFTKDDGSAESGIYANAQNGTLELTEEADKFLDKEEISSISKWLTAYSQVFNKTITIVSDGSVGINQQHNLKSILRVLKKYNIYIKGTQSNRNRKPWDDAPTIYTDVNKGLIEISGVAYGEFSHDYVQPFLIWLDNYLKNPNQKIILNFKLTYLIEEFEYTKRFLEIINILNNYKNNFGGEVIINWYYDKSDEDMRKQGEVYQHKTDLRFNTIPH